MKINDGEHFKYLQAPYVLLENSLHPLEGGYLFQDAHEIITAITQEDIKPAFTKIEQALLEGNFVAGYMTYELGLAFEEKLAQRLGLKNKLTVDKAAKNKLAQDKPQPLLWFGVFKEKHDVTYQDIQDWLDQEEKENNNSNSAPLEITPQLSFENYKKKFDKVKQNIQSGDIYQLNLTFKATIENVTNPLALYAKMRRSQPVEFASIIETGEKTILSASPELFISCVSGEIETRPMKGTAKRGISILEDEEQSDFLKEDEKSRAENLMIVDLMRNDFGRIAEIGTVNVTDLYKVETYPSLHQMVSNVSAKLKADLSIYQQIKALFPPGSITGAPKIRAMELIDELEETPRNVYTGAIGYFSPSQDYVFNVAIRTAELGKTGSGEIGIGSGLVYDSDVQAEYDECLLKMQFLTNDTPEFSLIETIGFNPNSGLLLLDEHLNRLEQSAAYFSYPFKENSIIELLEKVIIDAKTHLRIRLLLNKNGSISITPTEIEETNENEVWNICLVGDYLTGEVMQSDNLFLYHKTTNRAFFDDTRVAIQQLLNTDEKVKIHEVIFHNEQDQITEGSFTTIFAKIDGELKTPALQCGLLPGTLRQSLINKNEVTEAILTIKDLQQAEEIYVGNSVRGLVRAKLHLLNSAS